MYLGVLRRYDVQGRVAPPPLRNFGEMKGAILHNMVLYYIASFETMLKNFVLFRLYTHICLNSVVTVHEDIFVNILSP